MHFFFLIERKIHRYYKLIKFNNPVLLRVINLAFQRCQIYDHLETTIYLNIATNLFNKVCTLDLRHLKVLMQMNQLLLVFQEQHGNKQNSKRGH